MATVTEKTSEKIEPALISSDSAALFLGISRSNFYALLSAGRIGPEPVRLGKRVLWRVDELRSWVQAGCPQCKQWLAVQTPKYIKLKKCSSGSE